MILVEEMMVKKFIKNEEKVMVMEKIEKSFEEGIGLRKEEFIMEVEIGEGWDFIKKIGNKWKKMVMGKGG